MISLHSTKQDPRGGDPLQISSEGVHAWTDPLDDYENGSRIRSLARLLSWDELARSEPFLAEEDRVRFIISRRNSRVRFNTSHSRGLALHALPLDSEIGIDLEHVEALHRREG